MAFLGPLSTLLHRTKNRCLLLIVLAIAMAIGLGVGLGVGLAHGSDSDSSNPVPKPSSNNSNNNTNSSTEGSFWRPTVGTSWQIVLLYPLNDTSPNVSVYDIDLFDNTASTIKDLHVQNRKVICYFSAGSFEDWRPDADQFTESDKGSELEGWPGERWLNISSPHVRRIMSDRISLAASKGCDGLDPDNVDGFDNANGLGLTESDSVEFLTFLAIEAHSQNMAIGLKNAASIVNETIEFMQWELNEQCVEEDECASFQPFIAAGKPVFHIEYAKSAPSIEPDTKDMICRDQSTANFSTLLKEVTLNNFFEAC